MSALTAGNWIAYQNPAQEKHGHWSVGIENQYGIHGVGSGEHRDVSFDVGGICTEADAKAMAASKELLETVEALLKKHEAYHNSIEHAAARALLHKIREDA